VYELSRGGHESRREEEAMNYGDESMSDGVESKSEGEEG
jgi:hypothetical protein